VGVGDHVETVIQYKASAQKIYWRVRRLLKVPTPHNGRLDTFYWLDELVPQKR